MTTKTLDERRSSRYFWSVAGLDAGTVIIMEEGKYWRVVRLVTGEALMTAFDSRDQAEHWATARKYKVLQPL
jgi:hypothetical protein